MNEASGADCEALCLMSLDEVKKAKSFHQSFPEYKETPLIKLNHLAKKLGLGGIYVKDESHRFGLNAFKVLGGSYAMAKFMAKKLGNEILSFEELRSHRESLGEIAFYTATDGNHGRGVAWAAKQFGQKAVVYMPAGSSEKRRDNIRNEGAVCEIIDGANYDDCVRLAAAAAEKSGGVIVQDTAWDGYEEIPGWIMQGYGTMALEAAVQMKTLGECPTHIFIQAGVGSLAASVLGFFRNFLPESCPVTIVVEPHAANCLYKSALSGKREIIVGELNTIMAGLSCGEPNPVAWELLKSHTSFFASCPDYIAANGMRILSAPLENDKRIISGESGAVGLGLLAALMTRNDLSELKEALKLGSESRILLFSSEGDTDPEKYQSIIWDGECASDFHG